MAVLSVAALSLISIFKDQITATYTYLKDELNQALDDGLASYIGNQYDNI